ncbi:MAG: hypothetical protein ACREV9_12605, partial [Burkholderiales bacterium]
YDIAGSASGKMWVATNTLPNSLAMSSVRHTLLHLNFESTLDLLENGVRLDVSSTSALYAYENETKSSLTPSFRLSPGATTKSRPLLRVF